MVTILICRHLTSPLEVLVLINHPKVFYCVLCPAYTESKLRPILFYLFIYRYLYRPTYAGILCILHLRTNLFAFANSRSHRHSGLQTPPIILVVATNCKFNLPNASAGIQDRKCYRLLNAHFIPFPPFSFHQNPAFANRWSRSQICAILRGQESPLML